jgi:peptidoglycan hydrolase-like protein with peptidoglycan-binding domain
MGSSGPEVTVLQVMLNRIGRNYPAIPKIDPVDGVFGEQTENAVKRFQSIFGLTQDGIVGRGTWYKAVFLYVGVNDLSELISQGQTYYNVQFGPSAPILREGSSGSQVSALQYFLSMAAQFQYDIPAPAIDGVFGAKTREAVVAYQQQAGLTPDGVVGPATWNSLYTDYLGLARTTLDYAGLPTTAEELEAVLGQGQFPGISLSYGSQDERSRL